MKAYSILGQEKLFLYGPGNHQSYWFDVDDTPGNVHKCLRRGTGLTVLACFDFNAPGPLVFLLGKQPLPDYCGAPEKKLDYADEHLGARWLF